MSDPDSDHPLLDNSFNPNLNQNDFNPNRGLNSSKEEMDYRIQNRESLFKIFYWGIITVFIVIFLLIFIFNMVNGNIKFDFSDLRFTDLLSLIMAIFAIVLSTAFYFKATETSNTFYNNTYHFTSRVSEILGRIDSGFRERLRHIDEGQDYIKERFDKFPYINPESTKKEISDETKKLNVELSDKQKLINELLEKSALEQHEKVKFVAQLQEKDNAIDSLKRDLSHLSRQLTREETEIPMRHYSVMANYLRRHIPRNKVVDVPYSSLKSFFEHEILFLNSDFLDDMRKNHLLDNNNHLTKTGTDFILSIYRSERFDKEGPFKDF